MNVVKNIETSKLRLWSKNRLYTIVGFNAEEFMRKYIDYSIICIPEFTTWYIKNKRFRNLCLLRMGRKGFDKIFKINNWELYKLLFSKDKTHV